MASDYLNKTLWFIGLVLLQVLLLDKMTLMGFATPLAYVYLLLIWSKGGSRIALLVMGFVLGLTIDVFENMPGVNASACVLLAMLHPLLLNLFAPRDMQEEAAIKPSVKTMGWAGFMKFAVFGVLIHHTVVMVLVFFSMSDLVGLLARIFGCSLMTLFFVIVFELLKSSKETR